MVTKKLSVSAIEADHVKDISDVQPGKSFRIFWGKGNVNNKIVHVRAIVDEDIVVMMEWQKRRKRWHYAAETMIWYQLLIEKGRLRFRRDPRLPSSARD